MAQVSFLPLAEKIQLRRFSRLILAWTYATGVGKFGNVTLMGWRLGLKPSTGLPRTGGRKWNAYIRSAEKKEHSMA
jgi:hypothetical protein